MPGLIEDVDIFGIKSSQIPLRSHLTNIEQLAQSIKEKGLLQPIVIRPDNTGSFEIVAGNRRFNACKLLAWRKIPCHIVEIDDKEAFEISLIENIQRKALNPIEEAEAFKKYVSDFGWGGVSDLARKIGRSPAYITKRIKLLDLPEDVLEAILKSAISKSVAEELFSVKDKSRQSKLSELISKRHVSLRNARSLIKDNNADLDIENSESSERIELEKAKRAFDKSLIALRSCMSKLDTTINNIEENWLVYEILMHHRSMLHSQIDLLLRQKRKLPMKYRMIFFGAEKFLF